jgi:RNA polymerase sigma factor (sigma-70 family)
MTPAVFEGWSRELAPQVIAVLVRRYWDFAAVEDAVQEALIAAAAKWPVEGVPESPKGWLIQAASRRLVDEIRSNSARRQRESIVAMEAAYAMPPAEPDEQFADDVLTLMYMCCHPALTTASAIALTLRAVGGLTTAEIARAFLVPESTMGQRISRAKQTIKDSGIPFRQPERAERPARLKAVLHVLYLIFSEGYAASGGSEHQRNDLATEAIRLARLIHASAPNDPEADGLLALMLLTDARRSARNGPEGEIVPLDKQNRGLWNQSQIEEGVARLNAALSKKAAGPYQLQAAIAAVHDEAKRPDETDWPQILALYEILRKMSDNPVVELNHAVAAAMVRGPREGLALIEKLVADGRMRENHRLYAVRAHLYEMAGEIQAAIENYQAAAVHTPSLPERNYLLTQIARVRKEL